MGSPPAGGLDEGLELGCYLRMYGATEDNGQWVALQLEGCMKA